VQTGIVSRMRIEMLLFQLYVFSILFERAIIAGVKQVVSSKLAFTGPQTRSREHAPWPRKELNGSISSRLGGLP
jgi:hypothetical protein